MVKTYSEAKKYLEELIRPTVFARIEENKKLTDPLDRMRYLLELLGNPQNNYPAVQVSGTSGKGSTAYLLSHILATSDLKVGFTLSPHLEKINERIEINNVSISDNDFVSLLNEAMPSVEKMGDEWVGKPSYFEVILAMALLYFSQQHIDILVAEVGLEGRYEGTNVLHPLLAILTNISLDHTRILGDTVEKIAEEATSIIKEPNMTVITGVTQDSVKKIVKEKAGAVQARVVWVTKSQLEKTTAELSGSTFLYQSPQGNMDISLSLPGEFQLLNAALAIEAALALKQFSISQDTIRQALATAYFPGRFEVVKHDPLVVLDGAHNPAKMEAFTSSLQELLPSQKKVFVLAFKKEKDIGEMLRFIIPQAAWIYATEFSVPTDLQFLAATSAETIAAEVNKLEPNMPVESIPQAKEAYSKAVQKAEDIGGMVIITGSLYLVGEIRAGGGTLE